MITKSLSHKGSPDRLAVVELGVGFVGLESVEHQLELWPT